jgi:hypothetical protein
MRCVRDVRQQFAAGPEIAIDEVAGDEVVEHARIVRHMLRLPSHRRFPFDPEPGEVLEDRRLEFRAAAAGVEILDPQEETSARRAGRIERGQRREGVPQMEEPGGRGREAGDEVSHGVRA